MIEKKRINYTKKDISKNLSVSIGLSNLYSLKVTDSIIQALKDLIKIQSISIKNFGTFKVLLKKGRLGRNPKNNIIYKITARRTISFISSKRLYENLNK